MCALLLVLGLGGCTPEPVEVEVATLQGEIAWSVDFSAAAEEAGYTDCTYVRAYDAVEDRTAPWRCPDCAPMYRAEVAMVEGRDDCHAQVSDREPAATEWIGEAGDTFARTYVDNAALGDLGTIERDQGGFSTLYEVDGLETPEGHAFAFVIEGSLDAGTAVADPHHGLRPARGRYACGWPKADPPAWRGDPVATVGAPLPDGAFLDACSEYVRLHDLLDGAYLVIDYAAVDCGPCRVMADTVGDFEQGMREAGVEVRTATLLAPALSQPLDTADTELLAAWADHYELDGLVLADRGYGAYALGALRGNTVSFPTAVIVAPDGTVIERFGGFGGWDAYRAAILAHADSGR